MSRVSPTSIERAQEWCRQDPNKTTAAYVNDLLSKLDRDETAATETLSSLFPDDNSRIGFGTAGLRSAMEPGPLGMNDLVVIQTAQGIARYCQQQVHDIGNNKLKVVIGYDHRASPEFKLSSLSFALYSVLVFEAAGMEAILLDGYVHTPLVAFCTRTLNAAAGIMITASHNPKQDAGYKVYWKDGCQIRPPVDFGIADSIQHNLTPWVNYGGLLQSLAKKEMDVCCGLSHPNLTREMTAAYFEAISNSGLVTGQAQVPQDNPPTFCYTAMHGVGHMVAPKVFEVFGLPPFYSVPSQELPDPTFPTVTFPNPEEKNALDIAKQASETHNCDIILANDPDADRLAVAERDRTTGEWTVFTGDQIGTMLGHWLWTRVGTKMKKVKRTMCLLELTFFFSIHFLFFSVSHTHQTNT
jgi:phosphoglucomutase/phosphoglucomutase/phosphopentomutase